MTPNPNISLPRVRRESSVALIDEAQGPQPVLRRFLRAVDATLTAPVPGLVGQIFLSNNLREGPGAVGALHGAPAPSFTGTGSTGTGSAIRWGVVTGWTLSGTFWCHSSPGLVCSLAMGIDQESADPRFNSEFYDLGTWTFHGTGFDGVPFLTSYSPTDFGNTTLWVRGRSAPNARVPALSLLAGFALWAGLAAAGRRAASRRSGGC